MDRAAAAEEFDPTECGTIHSEARSTTRKMKNLGQVQTPSNSKIIRVTLSRHCRKCSREKWGILLKEHLTQRSDAKGKKCDQIPNLCRGEIQEPRNTVVVAGILVMKKRELSGQMNFSVECGMKWRFFYIPLFFLSGQYSISTRRLELFFSPEPENFSVIKRMLTVSSSQIYTVANLLII